MFYDYGMLGVLRAAASCSFCMFYDYITLGACGQQASRSSCIFYNDNTLGGLDAAGLPSFMYVLCSSYVGWLGGGAAPT